MARTPMKIPWSKVLQARDAPPPELVVTSSSGGAADGGSCCHGEGSVLGNVPGRELKERLERLRRKTADAAFILKLPDKGAKLLLHLRQVEEEVERRQRPVRVGDKETEDGRASQSKAFNSQESTDDHGSKSSQSNAESTFTLCFRRKLEADNSSCTIVSEKLQSANQDDRNAKQNGLHAYENSRFLRKLPACNKPDINASNVDERCSRNDDTDVASSSGVILHSKEQISRRFSKRRRARENQASWHWEATKIRDVVFLDEEDTPPTQPVREVQDSDRWMETKIYYPTRDHPECVEVCYADLKCLEPGSYTSSTIMNFYIQYLQKQESEIGRQRAEYHFFNTYFYKKLEEAVSCKVDKSSTFSKLRRWLKGVNLFQKAYVFLPIHGDLHWSLVIVCIPALEDESGPIILHLDSLGFHDSNIIFENIESYLIEEWRHVYQNTSPDDIPISRKIWDHLPRSIKRKKIMAPQQKNEYDCGLFVLYFTKRFIEEAPERLRRKDLAKFGSKWFQPEEASGLRKKIQQLLLEELKRAGHEEKLESRACPENPLDNITRDDNS